MCMDRLFSLTSQRLTISSVNQFPPAMHSLCEVCSPRSSIQSVFIGLSVAFGKQLLSPFDLCANFYVTVKNK